MKKRILVCGGRTYKDAKALYKTMDSLTRYFTPNFCIIQGGAKGADYLADCWAKSKGIPVLSVNANWDYYKNAAGPTRNQWMLDYCQPDLVVAFPGGFGTDDMMAMAAFDGVDVYEPF